MDPLIPIINDLQDVSNSVGVRELRLDLPQTVVIGAQSAGKSSVIEGFVGHDFLPRGTGVVTRNPLMLHLVYVAKGDARRDRDSRLRECDWAVFSHKPNELFLDFKDGVRKEIERKTEELSGPNKNISKTPIILTIYSESVANLSLVDLPGITKVKAGDQPDDIEKQTTDIVLEYISNPKSIILAFTPANQDFHTSESVKLAKEVDPKGKRTLVVLTKLDIMDAGTDAKDLLEGRVEGVKHMGIIGVVGRSQEDTNNGKPVADGLLAEEDFFRRKYPDIAHINGIKFLATALNRVMIKHIKKSLPMLLEQIGSEKNKFEMIKESFGSPVQLENKGDAVLYFISHFEKKYKATIQGGDECVEVNELSCGAQIALVTHETLREKLSTIWKTLTPNEVAIAIENVSVSMLWH
ncbi:dynamin central region family protein [Aphelenchoides avenae]|nr:dynamin central region family protein [Aphelenchus avenae]